MQRGRERFLYDLRCLITEFFATLWQHVEDLAGEEEHHMDEDEDSHGLQITDPSRQALQKEKAMIKEAKQCLSSLRTPLLLMGMSLQDDKTLDNPTIPLEIAFSLLEWSSYASLGDDSCSEEQMFFVNWIVSLVPLDQLLRSSFVPEGEDMGTMEFSDYICEQSRGVGWMWYLVFCVPALDGWCPSLYSGRYLLRSVTMHIVSLLRVGVPQVSVVALTLLSTLMEHIEKGTLHLTEDQCNKHELYILLCQELINTMSKHPEEIVRRNTYQTLRAFLLLFSESTQFRLLSLLIETCPYKSTAAELIQQQKNTIHRIVVQPVGSCSQQLILSSRSLYQQLHELQNDPTQFIQNVECTLSYLNLIRFLVVLDRTRGLTPVSRPLWREHLLEQYLHPQLKHAQIFLDDQRHVLASSDRAEQSLQSMQQFAGTTMPTLSREEHSAGILHAITDTQMIMDLTERVIELLEESGQEQG